LSDHHLITPDSTNVHLVIAWVGNAAAFLLGGMSPLQGVLVVVTLAFTILQAIALWRREFARRDQAGPPAP
jgi:hypothetical protein